MKKVLKILCWILLAFIAILALAWGSLSIAKQIIYKDYLAGKQDICTIPDLNSGFVPQGITYVESTGGYLHSGYRGDNLALYYVNQDDVRRFVPLDESGKPAQSHGGGVTATADFVYITNDSSLLVYRLASLLSAQDGDTLKCEICLPVDCKASYCSTYEDTLIVGEFYRAGNYETDIAHAYTTPNGDQNRAIACFYRIKTDGTLSDVPYQCLSVPGLVQGLAYNGNTVAISRSWGLNSSSLEFYTEVKETGQMLRCGETDVPLYYLDSSSLQQKLILPAFSEDLDLQNDRVIINFESACNKYIVGKLFLAWKAASYPFPAVN